MKETLEQYIQSIAVAKKIAEGDTLYFGELNADEQNVLSKYYFAFREPPDEKLLSAYREGQAAMEVDIEPRALRALGRLKQTAHAF
jgi:hypothetical protein